MFWPLLYRKQASFAYDQKQTQNCLYSEVIFPTSLTFFQQICKDSKHQERPPQNLLVSSSSNGGYQAHPDPTWRLERAQQTTIFRLCTGHCGLSAHLKRIGISDTTLCVCEQADQTSDHVLQFCPKYAERRQLTWPQGVDLVTKLWGSAEDLHRMAGLVASSSAGLKI